MMEMYLKKIQQQSGKISDLEFTNRFVVRTNEVLKDENNRLSEQLAEKDLIIQGALQRIEALEAIKEMYLGANNALLNELELYKLQENKLILQIQKQNEQIRELKQNSRATKYFEMAEENLRMATELEKLKRNPFRLD